MSFFFGYGVDDDCIVSFMEDFFLVLCLEVVEVVVVWYVGVVFGVLNWKSENSFFCCGGGINRCYVDWVFICFVVLLISLCSLLGF